MLPCLCLVAQQPVLPQRAHAPIIAQTAGGLLLVSPPTLDQGGRAGTLLKLTVAATFVIELPATALIIMPWRPLRVVGAALQAFLQARPLHAPLQATAPRVWAPGCSALQAFLQARLLHARLQAAAPGTRHPVVLR